MSLRPLASALLCCLLLDHSNAGNPLVSQRGMADTNVHFFNGTFLAFATHDFSINNTGFTMKNWQV